MMAVEGKRFIFASENKNIYNTMQNTIKKNTPHSKFGLKLIYSALRRTTIELWHVPNPLCGVGACFCYVNT